MVVRGTPLRGEAWICAFPARIGPHPVVILTINRIAAPLSAVTVVTITGTAGPLWTHIPLGPDAGLKKHDESYVNCTDVHTVRKHQLRRRLGLLAPGELRAVENTLRVVLGLD
ncbi:MAG: type II toxin-antitoxin system PemK/MazF family toxin [Streptosporangiaceae bacterium]